MKRWLVILLVIILVLDNALHAQHITPQSAKKEIKTFLKNKGGKEVDFCEAHVDVYFVKSKKTGKWGIYDWYGELLPMEYDTIQHFGLFQPFTLGKEEGQYVVIQWPYNTEDKGVRPIIGYEDPTIVVNVDSKISSASYFLIASKDGKWGCLDWKTLKEITPFIYATSELVPIDRL